MKFIQIFLFLYFGIDLILSVLTRTVLPMTRGIVAGLLLFILGRKSCHIGIHKWYLRTDRHRAKGLPHGTKSVHVYKKICEHCEVTYYSMNHPDTNMFTGWKKFHFHDRHVFIFKESRG